MVVIRLARAGRKKRPFFKIIVIDSRKSGAGRCIDQLGFYIPISDGEKGLRIAHDRLDYWIKVGAQPSLTVKRLIKESTQSLQSPIAPLSASAA